MYPRTRKQCRDCTQYEREQRRDFCEWNGYRNYVHVDKARGTNEIGVSTSDAPPGAAGGSQRKSRCRWLCGTMEPTSMFGSGGGQKGGRRQRNAAGTSSEGERREGTARSVLRSITL